MFIDGSNGCMLNYLCQHFEINQGLVIIMWAFRFTTRKRQEHFLFTKDITSIWLSIVLKWEIVIVTTTIDPHIHLIVATKENEIVDLFYKEVLRSLMYAMILTHLGIVCVVSCEVKFIEKPTLVENPPFLTKSFQLHDICNCVSIGFFKK
jgi:hypothetical protein